jgi:SNF2 family DNA or RNA helicase
MELRPYQEIAATFIYENDFTAILAPVGAGKTALTLTAMSELLRGKIVNRFLVLAPKRVCTDVWPVEAPKWARNLQVAVASGTPAQRASAFAGGANVVVMAYDNLQWLCNDNPKLLQGFDGLVFDELTKLKNASGARAKALFKHLNQFKIRVGLTGSFTSNGLEDVHGQMKFVDQTLLGRAKGAFMQQYFTLVNKDFGDWKPRPGSLELVMHRIKPATFVLEPGEYKDKLPPLHTVEVSCKMDMADYNKMKKDFVLDDVVAVNAAVVTQKLQQMSSGFLYSDNGPIWLSSHKFDRLEELLDENQHANTLLVYQYQEELAELKRRFKLTTLDDEGAIERWNRGEVALLAVHPKSAGHGLNLQHGGHHIVFLSLPWSLELYEQTVGRLHRSGQRHDVWCYVFLTDATVDHKIWRSLHDKLSLSQIALEALK